METESTKWIFIFLKAKNGMKKHRVEVFNSIFCPSFSANSAAIRNLQIGLKTRVSIKEIVVSLRSK
ncbi:MAG: hypothetical protein MJZ98_03400 [Paludibacteraceae bacterium]|nr:hypothetical protein [Paludibacteraceae bacterium]